MTFGMVLHRDRERVVAQARLLDDVIGGGPSFDNDSMTWGIDCLMMRAVHHAESMNGRGVVSWFLDVGGLCNVVLANIEMQGATGDDVQHLQAATDGQQRLLRGKYLSQRAEFPSVSRRVTVDDQVRL